MLGGLILNSRHAGPPSAARQSFRKAPIYLLDTIVVSELRKIRPHGAVVAWHEAVPDEDIHLSVVTLGEIQIGIELTREQDVFKAAEIEAWAKQVVATYNVLAMDAATFRVWAKLMHRQSDTVYEDAMIAATAKMNHLTVVSRNVAILNFSMCLFSIRLGISQAVFFVSSF